MDPQHTFCPNLDCPARGQCGRGNITIHSQRQQRYRCQVCRRTCSASAGTVFFGCRTPRPVLTLVLTLLAYGCPIAAIEAAFGFQARTVRHWQQGAGGHCEQVHHQVVEQPQALGHLGQVQADELRLKTQKAKGGGGGVFWMALALAVPTRLWLAGVVSAQRDKKLIRALAQQVRACAQCGPLLVAVDGLITYVRAFQQAFRTAQPSGQRGRPRLVIWPHLVIGRVIKQYGVGRWGRRAVRGVRHVLAQGRPRALVALLRATQEKGDQGRGTLNTAYIERLNATFRARLGCLVRRSRNLARTPATLHAGMYLVGTVYNCCTYHDSLRLPGGVRRTPLMAAGLSDHLWSVAELLWYRVPPPPWQPPKRRGRPSKALQQLVEKWASHDHT